MNVWASIGCLPFVVWAHRCHRCSIGFQLAMAFLGGEVHRSSFLCPFAKVTQIADPSVSVFVTNSTAYPSLSPHWWAESSEIENCRRVTSLNDHYLDCSTTLSFPCVVKIFTSNCGNNLLFFTCPLLSDERKKSDLRHPVRTHTDFKWRSRPFVCWRRTWSTTINHKQAHLELKCYANL